MQSQESSQMSESHTKASGQPEAAVIGPSIEIEGDLRGDEDLVIDGKVKGTVRLKSNQVTIGSKGKVTADVYAHTIYVDGFMKGDLYASERIVIRKSAKVQGNIAAPRVCLEEGARFKGTIEMDPEADALKSAFSDSRSPGKPAAVASSGKSDPVSTPSPGTAASSSGNGAGTKQNVAG